MATILLAEDDDSLRAFIKRALSERGHMVQAFGDGLSALPGLDDGPYDLLLTDIVMPGMSGIELARRGVARYPTMKAMFITGFAAVAIESRSSLDFDVSIVSKPFHLREVIERVDSILVQTPKQGLKDPGNRG